MRAPAPLPAPVDELSAAQQARAAAKTPKDIKDTEAELAAAKARVAAESDQKFQGTEAIKEAEHVTTLPPALDELPGLDDATKGRNEALDTFKQTTTAFRKLDDTDPAKGLKLPGDIAKAKADHDAARAAAALKVAQAHKAYDRAQSELETKAVDVAAKDWQRMPVQTVRALAQTAGIDTSKYSDDNLIQTLAEDPRFKLGKNSLPDRLRKLPASERHAVVDLLYAKKPITGSYKPHRIGEGPSIEDPNDLPIPYGAK